MANLSWMFMNVYFSMSLLLLYSALILKTSAAPVLMKTNKIYKNKKWLW